MPVDNERKHGGVAEPIRRFVTGILSKRKREVNWKALRFRLKMCADYYVYREIYFPPFIFKCIT
jgi:hypothetical protein